MNWYILEFVVVDSSNSVVSYMHSLYRALYSHSSCRRHAVAGLGHVSPSRVTCYILFICWPCRLQQIALAHDLKAALSLTAFKRNF